MNYLNSCLAAGAPNTFFTPAVEINNNKLKTTTL
jgi:hypothetical protein